MKLSSILGIRGARDKPYTTDFFIRIFFTIPHEYCVFPKKNADKKVIQDRTSSSVHLRVLSRGVSLMAHFPGLSPSHLEVAQPMRKRTA